jgi:pimeloyl-ACP methyl ester carboxylesterase
MTGRGGACKRAVMALVFLVAMTAARAEAGTWIRHEPSNHGVIVFVHGILGDERTTWTNGSSYWPEMLTHDHAFDGQDIYLYHYPSPLLGQAFTIDEVAENMRSVLTTDGVLQHTEITFVSHSMGGIVTRAFILKYRKEWVPKIRFLFFFATPTSGSPYALLVGLVSQNPQFKELYPMDPDSYLAPLLRNWLDAGMGLKSFCAYETQTFYGQIVVDLPSASNLCTEPLRPIDADHLSIVKPRDQNGAQYRALKEAFLNTSPPPNTRQTAKSTHPSPKEPTRDRRLPAGVEFVMSYGTYDDAGVTTYHPPGSPPQVIAGNTASKVVVYGNLLGKFKDRYKVAAICFLYDGMQDPKDTKGISKSAAFDIIDGPITMAIPWNDQFLSLFLAGKRHTNYVVLLLPHDLLPSQFDSIREATDKGAIFVEVRGGPP